MKDIVGRVAVVTGGASGIGRGIAQALIAEGAEVVIGDIQQDILEKVAHEIGAFSIPVDVTDSESVQALADATLEEFGRVDIIVNNAGVGPQAKIADMTLEDWRWMVEVNLFGVIHGVNSFLPVLSANADGGHIVNTSSMAAFSPQEGLGAYAVTKFGVAALTEVLRKELKSADSKVSTTLLAPGTVHTNIKASMRNRPSAEGSALNDVNLFKGAPARELRWMTPEEVGTIVMRAIRNDDAYALTHPEWWPMTVEPRNIEIQAAFEKYAAEDNSESAP